MVSRKKNYKTEKQGRRLPIVGIVVALFVGVAFLIRTVPPYNDIFVGQWIKFASNDAYYYMRLVDGMVANFPHLPSVDPYLVYPDGQSIITFHLFARLIASISWAIGLGAPTQHLINIVGAFVPAIMGALVVVPVYFIGRALWGSVAGLLSAALIAVLPGEFLGRSILGFADHHIAEVLFSTMSMLFLVLALKKTSIRRTVVYCTLAGLFWGMYGLTWQGGSLFLFIVCLYFVVQFITDHMRGRDVTHLCITGVVFNLVGMIVFLPSVIYADNKVFYLVSMGTALLLPISLWCLSRIMVKVNRFYYPIGILTLAGVGLWVLSVSNQMVFGQVAGVFQFVFALTSTQLTTIEMQPLLFPQGSFTLSIVWGNFGLALYGFMIGFLMLIWNAVKKSGADRTLLIVWSIVILAMALGQRRFAYYLSVNVALLNGYLLWRTLKWLGVEEWTRSISDLMTSVRDRKTKKSHVVIAHSFNMAIIAMILFVVCYIPLMPNIIAVAGRATYAPSNAWCESLDWLRGNSPESISDKADYSVLSWWDYGYWISRMGHRVPIVNPGQNPEMQASVASVLMSDNDSYIEAARRLGVKYAVLDFDMAIGKYWAIARYAGSEQSDYFGIYYVQDGNQLVTIQLFYPEYYKTLLVRLYNFDGEAVVPPYIDVIASETRYDAKGNPLNLVIDNQRFSTYGEALSFMSQYPEYRIVSNNPFVSPIPLKAVDDFNMAYASTQKRTVNNVGISEVKIFDGANN